MNISPRRLTQEGLSLEKIHSKRMKCQKKEDEVPENKVLEEVPKEMLGNRVQKQGRTLGRVDFVLGEGLGLGFGSFYLI